MMKLAVFGACCFSRAFRRTGHSRPHARRGCSSWGGSGGTPPRGAVLVRRVRPRCLARVTSCTSCAARTLLGTCERFGGSERHDVDAAAPRAETARGAWAARFGARPVLRAVGDEARPRVRGHARGGEEEAGCPSGVARGLGRAAARSRVAARSATSGPAGERQERGGALRGARVRPGRARVARPRAHAVGRAQARERVRGRSSWESRAGVLVQARRLRRVRAEGVQVRAARVRRRRRRGSLRRKRPLGFRGARRRPARRCTARRRDKQL